MLLLAHAYRARWVHVKGSPRKSGDGHRRNRPAVMASGRGTFNAVRAFPGDGWRSNQPDFAEDNTGFAGGRAVRAESRWWRHLGRLETC